MVLIQRLGGPTLTERGEYRVWLTGQPSEVCRRRFLKLARAKEGKRLRIALDEHAATLTFVSSGDVKADLQMIDLLLEEAVDDAAEAGQPRWLDCDPRRSPRQPFASCR